MTLIPNRVLGIDPGTCNVGYGVVEQQGNRFLHITSGTVRAKGESIAHRLVEIHRGLSEVIREYKPAAAAIETVFVHKNIKTAIAIGEGRGVAMLTAAEAGLEVFGYEPATVKKAVAGSGRAGKDQIEQMVQVLLGLPKPPESDHAADALAMALTHLRRAESLRALPTGVAAPRGQRRGRRR